MAHGKVQKKGRTDVKARGSGRFFEIMAPRNYEENLYLIWPIYGCLNKM